VKDTLTKILFFLRISGMMEFKFLKLFVCMCVYVHVHMRETETERDREREKERDIKQECLSSLYACFLTSTVIYKEFIMCLALCSLSCLPLYF
jgi:hypothetical protein